MYLIPNRFLFSILVLIPLFARAETVYLKDGLSITDQNKSVRPDVKSNSEMRKLQTNGFGFGFSPSLGIGTQAGLNLFYDHNLSSDSQLHVQVNKGDRSPGTYFDGNVLQANRSMILATYRYFPAENSGFYLGAGGGYAHSTLTYTSPSTSRPYKYTSTLKGVFVLGEIGWQVIDGYYFNVGLQPAAYITSSDNYDVNNIPNTSYHRALANDEHDYLKILSPLSIGFGWFF